MSKLYKLVLFMHFMCSAHVDDVFTA